MIIIEDLRYNPDGKLYIRKSMLETFKFCPMKFRKEYIERQQNGQNTYIMDIGTRFHEFAEWFFDIYQGIDVEQWPELVPNKFTPTEQEWASWFIQEETTRYHKDPDLFMPVMREMKIIDDELCLSGTFDRLDRLNDRDELAIVEYKTGRSFNIESISRQLAFYKLLWDNNIKKGTITHMRYVNPRLQLYKLIPLKPSVTDKLLFDIASMRRCLREDTFKMSCSPVKYIMCHMCDMDECGVYNYDERL